MIDYEKILRAYVSHVRACEGVTYIKQYMMSGTSIEDLTAEERKTLVEIDEETKQPGY